MVRAWVEEVRSSLHVRAGRGLLVIEEEPLDESVC
jgi:hypothetical protein